MKLCLTTIPSATGANSYFTEGKNTDGPLYGVAATFLSPAPKEKGIKMKKRCCDCKFLEEQENKKGWFYCPKHDWKIAWKWAVTPPPMMPELSDCKFFEAKSTGNYRCYNDPDYYRKLKE